MKVIDHLRQADRTLYSFEILPPLKGSSIQAIYNTLDPLMEFKPSFINVTYHRSEYIYKVNAQGLFEKKMIRKRPGTAGICAAITTKYKIDAVPHLICGGFSVDETEDVLIELNFLGIENVLLLRGDNTRNEENFIPEKNGHAYAIDLVKQVIKMNHGEYLEEDLKNSQPSDFCVGVAGYPEKHFEAPNMQTDLRHLKAKVDAGADYVVTQLFFDNQKFYDFVKACRDIGITVPIIPGIKPITSKKQVKSLPRIFFTSIPNDLNEDLENCEDDVQAARVGRDWCIEQCRQLIRFGVPALHFYTMSASAPVYNVVKELVS